MVQVPPMMRKILFISVLFIICEMITEIVLRYPCNHGNNSYVHAAILALFLLLSLINLKKNIGVIVGAFIGLLFVLGVNYFNVGIDYDTWIERGMPEWGEYTTCPSPMNRRKGFETIPATDTDHARNPHLHSPCTLRCRGLVQSYLPVLQSSPLSENFLAYNNGSGVIIHRVTKIQDFLRYEASR